MIKKANTEYKNKVKDIFIEKWNTDFMVSKSQIHYINDLESFIFLKQNNIIGLLTFYIKNDEMEIVSLDSFEENIGIGTLLINEAINFYKQNSLKRLWLITTNDNLKALKFYQKRNFNIAALHFNAIEKSRQIKPSIPKYGYDNIPILHEIELEYCI